MRVGLPTIILAAAALVGCGGTESPPSPPAGEGGVAVDAGWVAVEAAYLRPSLPPHTLAAGFLTLVGRGEDLSLVEVRTPGAGRVELHTMADVQGRMVMRRVDRFDLAPDGRTVLERGGDHLMFFELDAAWELGRLIPLTLVFADGRELELELPVLDPPRRP